MFSLIPAAVMAFSLLLLLPLLAFCAAAALRAFRTPPPPPPPPPPPADPMVEELCELFGRLDTWGAIPPPPPPLSRLLCAPVTRMVPVEWIVGRPLPPPRGDGLYQLGIFSVRLPVLRSCPARNPQPGDKFLPGFLTR
ncbi:hypothetical protein BJV82DRAFT_113192 [Fennellomyces sp. T-0311]|nr:hypothetical protein BJV82DRAFT_113192 [Fennellomyces sp. T-0311]